MTRRHGLPFFFDGGKIEPDTWVFAPFPALAPQCAKPGIGCHPQATGLVDPTWCDFLGVFIAFASLNVCVSSRCLFLISLSARRFVFSGSCCWGGPSLVGPALSLLPPRPSGKGPFAAVPLCPCGREFPARKKNRGWSSQPP